MEREELQLLVKVPPLSPGFTLSRPLVFTLARGFDQADGAFRSHLYAMELDCAWR